MRDGTQYRGPLAGLGAGAAGVLFASVVLALAWHRVAGQVSTGIVVLMYVAVGAVCAAALLAVAYAVLWLRHRVHHPETLTRHHAETAEGVVAAPPIGGGAEPPRAIEPPRVYLNVTDDQFAALMRRHSDGEGEVITMAKGNADVKLTGNDKGGKLDKILGAGSNPKNK